MLREKRQQELGTQKLITKVKGLCSITHVEKKVGPF
jgi:hypothetical protein